MGGRAYCIMVIQTGTDTVFHTPHEVLQSALSDSVLFLEKATVGRAQMSDISDALSEYKRLFSVKLASPAEILTLARAYPDNQKYAKAAEGIEDDSMPVVVGGPASVEMVDREGHLITTNALTKAFKKYMANFRTRNTMVMHSDVQVGWALPAYITKGGSVFRSGVDPRGLFFITELRNDTRIAAKVKEQIESGKMRSYSIAGNATETKDIHKEDGTKIMQVDNLELAEVTICEKGVNQGAHFDLMKGMILDKEQSTPTHVSSNDLLLEETLSKFQKAGPIDRLTGGRVKFETNPDKQANPSAAKGGFEVQVQTRPGSIPDRTLETASKIPGVGKPIDAPKLNKSTPMLGMFQEFMEKAKGSTDTPLGLQTNHPDQQGEDDRRAQLKRIQEEFGLPEETQSAEYNRRAPVDYKLHHSFTSSRVVNQSGQDSAVAQSDDLIKEATERLHTLRKGQEQVEKGIGSVARTAGKAVGSAVEGVKNVGREAKVGFKDSQGDYLDNKGVSRPPVPMSESTRKQRQQQWDSTGIDARKNVDKVLSKLFQKAGQNKEDRTPGNSAKPNEFPADTSTSPYQSKGVFEKQHVEKILPLLGALARTAATVAASTVGEAAGEEANEKLNLSKDAIGTTNRGFRQEGRAGRKASFKGIKGSKPQRPDKYKDIDRTTASSFDDKITSTQETDYAPPALKNSIQKKEVSPKVSGMGQQRSQQGPTTNPGDHTRAAQPTMRQSQPWDEKSLEKGPPSLGPSRGPEPHDAVSAAANRKRVSSGKGEPSVLPNSFKHPADPATQLMDRQVKRREAGEAGFPKRASLSKTTDSPDSDYLRGWGTDDATKRHIESLKARDQQEDSERRAGGGPPEKVSQQRRFRSAQSFMAGTDPEKAKRLSGIKPDALEDPRPPRLTNSLLKYNSDPVEEGKAILAMPFNLATQMIMGKKAPSAVSADDRLRESVLILLKQASAQEIGQSLLSGGQDWEGDDAGGNKTEKPSTVSEPAKAKPTVNPLPKPVTPTATTPDAGGKAATEAAGLEYASKMTKSSIRKESKTTKRTNSSNV